MDSSKVIATQQKPTTWRTICGITAAFATLPMIICAYIFHMSMLGSLYAEAGAVGMIAGDSIPIIPDLIYAYRIITSQAYAGTTTVMALYGAMLSLAIVIVGFLIFKKKIDEES